MKKTYRITLLFFIFSINLFSQTKIDLKTAIDLALKNNLTLKSEYQKTAYQKQLIKLSATIFPTTFVAQYGQINSIYNDNSFGISQTFNFPVVYAKQKKLLTEEWKLAQLNSSLKESEIVRIVSITYYSLLCLAEKEKLLLHSDSIYIEFIQRAELRFKTGESNVIEKIIAKNQQADITLQLKQLQQSKATAELYFKWLLNTNIDLELNEPSFKMNSTVVNLDTNSINSHPFLKTIQQQQVISKANTQLEKSKLLPDIILAYNNMSMKGSGADNNFYSGSKRFQSVQVGIGIPLFMQSHRAKIEASKINQEYTSTIFDIEQKQLQNQYLIAYADYIKQSEIITYYEKEGLANANEINAVASKQFINGEINYLNWVLLINQSIAVKSNYLDAWKVYNESIIQLNYLTSKN